MQWRLLQKKPFLSLQGVYEIAKSLEQAKKQSAYYEQGNIITATIISSE